MSCPLSPHISPSRSSVTVVHLSGICSEPRQLNNFAKCLVDIMGDHEVITCLSVIPHDHNILDVCLHYFGCLRYEEGSDYFNSLNTNDQGLILDRERRIRRVKDDVMQDANSVPVLNDLAESLHEFRNLATRVRPIRHTYNGTDIESGHRSCDGMSARMVLFKDSRPYRDPRFPQQWPDQKLPLGDLLYDKSLESNPLVGPRSSKDNMIQWFHLPANDMGWIEVCGSSVSILNEMILMSNDRKS